MTKFLCLVLGLVTFGSFSQQRGGGNQKQIAPLVRKSMVVTKKIRMNLRSLNRNEKQVIREHLAEIEAIIDGGLISIPHAPVCSSEIGSVVFNQTFEKIRAYAFSSSGALNYGTTAAIQFAQDWVNKYPCYVAQDYVSALSRLYKYYHRTVDYGWATARTAALAGIDQVCLDYSFESEYDRQYKFARNQLSKGFSDSRDYALKMVKVEMYRCQPFNFQ